jgi:hypothetical protein
MNVPFRGQSAFSEFDSLESRRNFPSSYTRLPTTRTQSKILRPKQLRSQQLHPLHFQLNGRKESDKTRNKESCPLEPLFGTNSRDSWHTLLNFRHKSPIVLGSTFQESCLQTTKNLLPMATETLELLGNSCKI